jgi:hypothetical protein
MNNFLVLFNFIEEKMRTALTGFCIKEGRSEVVQSLCTVREYTGRYFHLA